MVWTQESFHKSVRYDCPGECSPEKDCLWWHWLMFRQPEQKSSSESIQVTDVDFRSGCREVSQCHHKQSFSGLHSPGRSYFTKLSLQFDALVSTTIVSQSFLFLFFFSLLANACYLSQCGQDGDIFVHQQKTSLTYFRQCLMCFND